MSTPHLLDELVEFLTYDIKGSEAQLKSRKGPPVTKALGRPLPHDRDVELYVRLEVFSETLTAINHALKRGRESRADIVKRIGEFHLRWVLTRAQDPERSTSMTSNVVSRFELVAHAVLAEKFTGRGV